MGSSKTLNEAIKENGKDKFSKKILVIFDTRKLAAEHEIKLHEHFDVGVNPLFWNRAKATTSRLGFNTVGVVMSDESRQKMSERQIGKLNHNYGTQHTEEHKLKIGLAGKGRIVSEETKRKISSAQKGELNHMYGKYHSKESIQRMSEVKTGKKHTEETKRKMSLAQRGENHHMYGKKGKNNPNFGRHHTEETKRKISLARKGK